MYTNASIEIKLLTDHPEFIPALAKLWFEEISRHWAPNASTEKATQRLAEHLNSDTMPLAYVAIADHQPIGMACLRENDGIRPGVTPWLGSLVVHPQYRANKVGMQLIEAVKSKARVLGYQTLYLLAFDPTIPNWYTRLGWRLIGEDQLFDHRVTVMDIPL